MTLANQISIARLLLTPVFVGFCLYYAFSLKEGRPEEHWRWLAIVTFFAAIFSDGLDGFVARRFNQRSRLGAILDPLADKALLLAAVITFSFTIGFCGWPESFPLWFPIVVIARDGILIAGTFALHYAIGDVHIRPRITGKIATFFQMATLSWLLLRLPQSIYPAALAGIFTLISGLLYIRDGIRQVHHSGHGEADSSR